MFFLIKKLFSKPPRHIKCIDKQYYESNENVRRYIDLRRQYMKEHSTLKEYWENYFKYLDN